MTEKSESTGPGLLHVSLDGAEMAGLVEELTARGASARFVARGGSMSPWIRDGDVVTVTPVTPGGPAAPLRPGDVAAFRRPGSGSLTVHRLVRRSSGGWIARGDRLAGEDGLVPDGDILGTVTKVERRGSEAYLPGGPAAVLLARLTRAALVVRMRLGLARGRGAGAGPGPGTAAP